MTKELDEVKRKHAAQIEDILRKKHPRATPGQIAKVQAAAAAQIGDWQIAPLLRELNEMTVDGILFADKSVTRAVPTQSAALEFKMNKLAEELEIDRATIPAQREIELAREIEGLSPDELLALVPATFAAPDASRVSHAADLEAAHAPKQMTQDERDEADDKFLMRRFGSTFLDDPFKRRELLAARDEMSAPTLQQRADAQTLDTLHLRHGDKPDAELSGMEMMTRARAQAGLKGRD